MTHHPRSRRTERPAAATPLAVTTVLLVGIALFHIHRQRTRLPIRPAPDLIIPEVT